MPKVVDESRVPEPAKAPRPKKLSKTRREKMRAVAWADLAPKLSKLDAEMSAEKTAIKMTQFSAPHLYETRKYDVFDVPNSESTGFVQRNGCPEEQISSFSRSGEMRGALDPPRGALDPPQERRVRFDRKEKQINRC